MSQKTLQSPVRPVKQPTIHPGDIINLTVTYEKFTLFYHEIAADSAILLSLLCFLCWSALQEWRIPFAAEKENQKISILCGRTKKEQRIKKQNPLQY